MIPFAIDNLTHKLADVLNELLRQAEDRPVDIATAYFSISGYRLVKEQLHSVGSFRLLIGSDPQTGVDVGLKPNAKLLAKRMAGDVEAEREGVAVCAAVGQKRGVQGHLNRLAVFDDAKLRA